MQFRHGQVRGVAENKASGIDASLEAHQSKHNNQLVYILGRGVKEKRGQLIFRPPEGHLGERRSDGRNDK